MYEVLTNPSTLLCLGVIFLLVSLLFFYFKRSIFSLEKAQVEQAKVLQSFIANMEMTQAYSRQHMNVMQNHNVGGNSMQMTQEKEIVNNELIDVSDGEGESEDSDEDSDDESEDSDDESEDSNDEVSNNAINTMDVEEIDTINVEEEYQDIKVIQLEDENNLEEALEIENLENSDDESQDNSDDESDDENDENSNSNNSDENHVIINKESINDAIVELDINIYETKEDGEIDESDEMKNVENEPIKTNYKSLNVQTLRQIAEKNGLIEKGEKKNKKELLEMLH